MKKNTFLEGAFIASAAIIISKLLGLIYVIPFYSIIGEQGGSLYGYAYNIYNFFLIISTAGIPIAISKLTSEYNTLGKNENKVRMYKLARKVIGIFSIASFLICFIFAKEIANLIIGDLKGGNNIEDVSFVIRMVSFALLIIPHLGISRGYLQGHKYITASSTSQVIEQIIRIIFILGGSYLTLKVFHLSLRNAVGVAVFGSAIGGLTAYFYLGRKYAKNKFLLKSNEDDSKENKERDREIIKKIISYSIPLVIISIANTLYNNTDMILILRTLPYIGYTAEQTETISSILTTWGAKIEMIITSLATGVIVSLIPNIVSSFVKNDLADVNDKFNKTLQMLFLLILPIALTLSILSRPVWGVFYGNSSLYGPMIIKITILIAFLDCTYMVLNSFLQGIGNYKLVYFSVCVGLLTDLALDVPLMMLFHKLGFEAFYGAIVATAIGFSISIIIPMIKLKVKYKFSYRNTLEVLPRLLLSTTLIIVISKLLQNFVSLNQTSVLMKLLVILLYGIIFAAIHIFINYKNILPILPASLKKKLHITK